MNKSNREINIKDITAFSNLHSQFESRLASLETNAFTFVAVVISVFLGLGHVYTNSPNLLRITCATVGALLVLGFGIFYVQATAHAFRAIQLVMSRLEGVLKLNEAIPLKWDPVPGIRKGQPLHYIPEMLKVQFNFYLIMGGAVFILLYIWGLRHNCVTQSNWLYFASSPTIWLVILLFVRWWYDRRLIGKQRNLLNEQEKMGAKGNGDNMKCLNKLTKFVLENLIQKDMDFFNNCAQRCAIVRTILFKVFFTLVTIGIVLIFIFRGIPEPSQGHGILELLLLGYILGSIRSWWKDINDTFYGRTCRKKYIGDMLPTYILNYPVFLICAYYLLSALNPGNHPVFIPISFLVGWSIDYLWEGGNIFSGLRKIFAGKNQVIE